MNVELDTDVHSDGSLVTALHHHAVLPSNRAIGEELRVAMK
jgi:hypothetical protein